MTRSRWPIRACAALAIGGASLFASTANAQSHPGPDQLPFVYELPNLFKFNDGTPLTTLEQWQARREEIKDFLNAQA